jgi:hypothetical protein
MLAFLEGSRSCENGQTACQLASEACPETSKDRLEGTEAAVVSFEESSVKMEAADLGATQEETEGAVEQQELCNEEVRVDTKCH